MAVEPHHFDAPIVMVGGSVVNWDALKTRSHLSIVAVDGGGNRLAENGLAAQYLCGDFDSISDFAMDEAKRNDVEICPLVDQNHTDFAKALDQFCAPVIYAFGFLGGRLDHALDALAQISARADRRIYLIGDEELAFVFPPKGELTIKAGARMSLWSSGVCDVAYSRGLKWALDGVRVSAASMSISNEVSEEGVMIDYQGDPLIALCEMNAIDVF